MQGKKAPATRASGLPRPHRMDKTMPYERPSQGQGLGESDVPAGARRIVQAQTRQIRLPRSRR